MLDRVLHGLDIPYVGVNNRALARMAVLRLIEAGHRRIALLALEDETSSSLRERMQGCTDAFVESALAVALFLNNTRKTVGIFRTLFYLPVLSSSVANATLWSWIFNPKMGLLNGVLALLGIQGPSWLFETQWAMPAIVIMSLWSGYAGNMMIFVAALRGIPRQYYEAAVIDGANRRQQFFHITVPSIRKTTFFVSTMLIIGTFQVFDAAYLLTGGGPGNATITIVYYIYNRAFKDLRMGYASAMSLVPFFVILFFSLINMRINRSDD